MSAFHLQIVTPDGSAFDGQAEALRLRTTEGYVSIRAGHADYLAVLDIGVDMVRFLAPCYITYILIELIAGAVRGAGKSVGPMLIDVFGVCGLRLAWLFLVVPVHHTLTVVMFSYPITWTVTSVALLIYYFFGRWLKEPSPAP